ncbi:RDD family protein [Brevibacterium oceani]|uniref:RDD family protein n=1 Tax=Brevibacterium oceani TaxID=358099 RepID=UPI0015E6BCE5|nr:RDD family protein [Brevibacterium oceani]
MSANFGSPAHAGIQDHANGTLRNGQLLPPAPASRRRWARVLDAVFVLALTALIATAALSLEGAGVVSIDAATAAALISYPFALLVFGALYGCTVSPGQALTGVVSLQKDLGRRVGFGRGMGRYLAVGFFPIVIVLVIWTILDAPTIDTVPIRVYRRVPQTR